ncbi:MAG: radical SAM protein [Kofleriaceae bacterium]
MTDLLLLNATNLPWRPIFPYAFVQVSAVARRHGLSVETIDLLDIPRARLPEFLRSHLEASRPRMVGLHVRQGDSVFIEDYFASPNGPQTARSYFPIDDNQHLVRTLRDLTRVPIIAGGFGFTTHARRLYEHLGIDYGVMGDPDAVFASFEDVVAGRDLGRIQSLIHRDGSQVTANERGYFQPYEGLEYTDEIFDRMVRFYGHSQLFGSNPPTVAVEVMRGCPFSCFFCTEPYVKGRNFRYRNLDVVEAEVDALLRRQIRRFWFICSELDIQGVKFGLELSERIIRLREKHGGAPIEWSAYALPRLDESELRTLQRAGYVGALNDVLSLDDDNLRKARVPYRSKQAVGFLKAVVKLDKEDAAATANAEVAGAKITAGLTQRTPKELAATVGLFLGNAHATPETIANTLKRIDEEGLREYYRAGLPFPSTRVFAPDGAPICETTERGLRSFGPEGEREIDFIHPTFYFADFLIERLGSPAAIVDFMRYVGETFMSIGHRTRKDWAWFLSNHIEMNTFGALAGLDELAVRRLYAPHPMAKTAANAAAKTAIDNVLAAHPAAGARIREALQIPDAFTEYTLARVLYEQFDSRAAVVAAATPATPIEQLYLDWLLYANNVVIEPAYRELLFGPRVS